MDRHELLEQYRRIDTAVRRNTIDANAEIAAYDAELSTQRIPSNEPAFQEGEYKAELSAIFADQIRSAQSDMAALGVTALYHHWERCANWLVARTGKLHPPSGKNMNEVQKIKYCLDFNNLPAACQKTFDQIDIGRLIANVMKHGEGSSARHLRERDMRYFIRPWADANFKLPSDHPINLIWVMPEDLEAVSGAIRRFWGTLPDHHFPPARPLTLEASINPDLP